MQRLPITLTLLEVWQLGPRHTTLRAGLVKAMLIRRCLDRPLNIKLPNRSHIRYGPTSRPIGARVGSSSKLCGGFEDTPRLQIRYKNALNEVAMGVSILLVRSWL